MQLPYFFTTAITSKCEIVTLDEETSRHVVSVLRMKTEEQLHLTDGKGTIATARIISDHKKRCEVEIVEAHTETANETSITIAISLLKNTSRFEWFLEKATEIGITSVIPLICERTERQHFRKDRMEGVLVSAMLQSRQCWLPELQEPVHSTDFFSNIQPGEQAFIAHCDDQHKLSLQSQSINKRTLICIGPEGDFSAGEITMAIKKSFIAVTLGETRLRTETAALVASVLLKFQQKI